MHCIAEADSIAPQCCLVPGRRPLADTGPHFWDLWKGVPSPLTHGAQLRRLSFSGLGKRQDPSVCTQEEEEEQGRAEGCSRGGPSVKLHGSLPGTVSLPMRRKEVRFTDAVP